jgi:hypothetical protein
VKDHQARFLAQCKTAKKTIEDALKARNFHTMEDFVADATKDLPKEKAAEIRAVCQLVVPPGCKY